MFKVNNKETRTTSMAYFKPFSSNSVIDFEKENVCWVNNFILAYQEPKVKKNKIGEKVKKLKIKLDIINCCYDFLSEIYLLWSK